MTKYTIFCVLGLALVIAGGKQWLMPGSANNAASSGSSPVTVNPATGEIAPLINTAHADSLAGPNPSNGESPQTDPAARQPDRSFTPGSTFLAQAAQDPKDSQPGPADVVAPSVLVQSTQPAPLVIQPTFKPQPREANPNAVVLSKQETPLADPASDAATERPRLPADVATQEAATTAESATMIADATAKSMPSFTTLKPLDDGRTLLQFPTTANMQIHLGGGAPIGGYGQAQPDTGLQQQVPITQVQRQNEMRNPDQVKADSLVSHNLLQGAQLAYQQPQFPEGNKLSGKELTIQDLFILTSNREQRFGLLKAYWKIALAMAEYHWAVEEYLTIRTLDGVGVVGGRASPSHTYIEAAIFSSMARVSETRTQAVNAQYELLALMGGQYRHLPLSIDVPLVGTYNTQFEANYPDGRAPKRLQAINKTIDNRRDTVNSRGIAIDRVFKAWQAAIGNFQRDPSEQNAQVVAVAYEQITRQRRNFLASIREYNSDIAEYALSVLNPGFRPEQLARYLTRTPSPRPLWNTSAMIPRESPSEDQPGLANVRSDSQVRPATFSDESAGEDWSQKTHAPLPSVMKQSGN
jgi:hypothetical protein